MPKADIRDARAANREYMAGARKRAREIIEAAKSRPCADCNKEWPYYVMHFDHVRAEKSFTIAGFVSKMSASARSFQMLHDEIAKCDVVCANCHALRHGGVFADYDGMKGENPPHMRESKEDVPSLF